jgi:hypothetical protein
VQFKFKLPGGRALSFPEQSIAIPSGATAILPFNMDIEDVNLQYGTVQPLCKIDGDMPTYVFFAVDGIRPELVFNSKNITSLIPAQGKVKSTVGRYLVNQLMPGQRCYLQITSRSGKRINVLILSQQQALDSWKGYAFGAERLFISKQDLQFNRGDIKMQSINNPHLSALMYPALKSTIRLHQSNYTIAPNGLFSKLTVNLPAVQYPVTFNQVSLIEPFLNRVALLPIDDRIKLAEHNGPQYQTNLTAVDQAAYWQINVPKLNGRALLKLEYKGDTGSTYAEGKLVADDYYYGKPMLVDANTIGRNSNASKIIFQVIPFKNNASVYLQKQAKPFTEVSLSSVKLLPVYETVIK